MLQFPTLAQSNYFRSSFEGRPLSLASSHIQSYTHQELWGKRASGVRKRQQSYLDTHHLSLYDPGKQSIEPQGSIVRCFKYPQSKLLKISLVSLEAR